MEGMLQGPLPSSEVIVDELKSWVEAAKNQGLRFHLQVEGANFSVLADTTISKTSSLKGKDVDELIEDALGSLLKLLPEGSRKGLFSTVRSEEFRPGEAVQTLYAVAPNGEIASQQRTVDVDTEMPPPEITAASVRRFALVALPVLLLMLFVSSFFIDYKKMFSQARDEMVDVTVEEVSVKDSELLDVVEIKLVEIDNRRKLLIFEIERGPGWAAAIGSSPSDSSGNWQEFLLRQAVHLRVLRVELFDKKGKPLGYGEISLDGLRDHKKAKVGMVARPNGRMVTVVVRP